MSNFIYHPTKVRINLDKVWYYEARRVAEYFRIDFTFEEYVVRFWSFKTEKERDEVLVRIDNHDNLDRIAYGSDFDEDMYEIYKKKKH